MEYLNGLLITLALVAQEWLPEELFPDEKARKARAIVKFVVWGIALLVLPAAAYFYRKGWLSIGWLRRFRHHCAHFEGVWLQRVGLPDRPYSIAIIRPASDRRFWIYEGLGFGRDFHQAAEWQTESLLYRADAHDWYFTGAAAVIDAADLTKTKDFSVLPILRLAKDKRSNWMKGLVSDLAVETPQAVFKTVSRRMLVRKDQKFARRLRTIEDLKDLEPAQVNGLFDNVPRFLVKP